MKFRATFTTSSTGDLEKIVEVDADVYTLDSFLSELRDSLEADILYGGRCRIAVEIIDDNRLPDSGE